ncbi:hypothetical protein BGZ94_010155 [Podila epigama]|nr:hypothetical protein BGZ94_010155 [Podila epigama]
MAAFEDDGASTDTDEDDRLEELDVIQQRRLEINAQTRKKSRTKSISNERNKAILQTLQKSRPKKYNRQKRDMGKRRTTQPVSSSRKKSRTETDSTSTSTQDEVYELDDDDDNDGEYSNRNVNTNGDNKNISEGLTGKNSEDKAHDNTSSADETESDTETTRLLRQLYWRIDYLENERTEFLEREQSYQAQVLSLAGAVIQLESELASLRSASTGIESSMIPRVVLEPLVMHHSPEGSAAESREGLEALGGGRTAPPTLSMPILSRQIT